MDINIVIPFPRKLNRISDVCRNHFWPFIKFHPIWYLNKFWCKRENSSDHILSCFTVRANIARKINIVTFGTAIGFCESIFGWAGLTNFYSTIPRTIHSRMDINIVIPFPHKLNRISDVCRNHFWPFIKFHPIWYLNKHWCNRENGNNHILSCFTV